MALNPLPSWQDFLYLASLSMIQSPSSSFTRSVLLRSQRATTWCGIVFLYFSGKCREGETDAEIWSDASKNNFQFGLLGRVLFCFFFPGEILGPFSLLIPRRAGCRKCASLWEFNISSRWTLWKQNTTWTCSALFTLHSRLLCAKCLCLKHHG